MNFKILSALAVLLTVSACETAPGDGANVGNGGNVAAMNGADGSASYGDVTPGTQADLVANVGDRVFFGYDSSVINDESKSVLDKQASWLKQYGSVSVTVEGHCDERGTREYNMALGERRASAVKGYLVAQGVESARVQTTTYGKERPAVVGSDESSWAQNRRGVTVVNEGVATN